MLGHEINNEACKLAREVAEEGDCFVAGGFSQHPNYQPGTNKEKVQEVFRKQVDVFVENGVDFLICEYFQHVEEIMWAIKVCKESKLPLAANMCIGLEGDVNHISCGECAVKAAMRLMKKALDVEGLKAHLMCQPSVFHMPDAGRGGYSDLPEFPFTVASFGVLQRSKDPLGFSPLLCLPGTQTLSFVSSSKYYASPSMTELC
ncbi:betaine--homocysteine S-methyltransferase 1-like [Tachypleus tridentatus]|uniref:betaine--homocysteine S-methyltransferase 1-like n=1 Tax=Tachypleus tridentatus TaxID=6853 RepID=UPI003FD5BEAE